MSLLPLDEMLAELKASGLRKVDGHLTAESLNRANSLIGCPDDVVVDQSFPGAGDGSDLFVALMYQNLLLAQRIEDLEDKLAEE